jgi:hypothetical protein
MLMGTIGIVGTISWVEYSLGWTKKQRPLPEAARRMSRRMNKGEQVRDVACKYCV